MPPLRRYLATLQRSNLYYYGFALFFLILSFYNLFAIIILALYLLKFRRKYHIFTMIVLFVIISVLYLYQSNESSLDTINNKALVIRIKETEYSDQVTIKYNRHNYNFYTKSSLEVGQYINIKGLVKPYDDATIPNGFSPYNYYKGINIAGFIEQVEVVALESYNYRYHLEQVKRRLVENIDDTIKPYVTTFFYREHNLDNEISNNLKALNIIHLISLSGIHIVALLFLIRKIMHYFNVKMALQNKIELIFILLLFVLSDFNLTLFRIIIYYCLKYVVVLYNYKTTNLSLIQITFFLMILIRHYILFNRNILIMYLLVNGITLLSPLYKDMGYYFKGITVSLIAAIILLPFTMELNILSVFLMPLFIILILYIIYPITLLILFFNNVGLIFIPLYHNIPIFFSFMLGRNNFIKINIAKMQSTIIIIYYIVLILILIGKNKFHKIINTFIIIGLLLVPIIKRQILDYRFYFLDVGQGDSFVYIDAEVVIVIDSYRYVGEFLNSMGITKIDFLILSHSHQDHSMEAQSLIDNFNVKHLVLSRYDKYHLNHSNTAFVGDKYEIRTSNVFIDFFGPIRDYGNANDNSLVFKFNIGTLSILFTGDAEQLAEIDLVDKYSNKLKSDVLKVGHHGSVTSSRADFLKVVGARDVIISLGRNNKHGFPNNEVLKRLNYNNANIYRTDLHWTIIIYKGKIYKYRYKTMKNNYFIV